MIMEDPVLHDMVVKFKEYGRIYKNIKSDRTKEQLVQSAPAEVLEAYAIVAKNILVGNIGLTKREHHHLRPYRKLLNKLGFNRSSAKVKKRALSEGDIFVSLSKIMAKLTVK